MELYTTYHAKFVKTTEWAQKNTASKLTVLNILILNYYFLFFCKNVGIVIPLSLTCGVTGDGCLSPGSGASFDTEDVFATGLEDGNVNKAMAGFAGMAQATRPTVNVKPQYTYSQPAAKTSSVSNDAPLPGLKQPSPVAITVIVA